MPTFGQRMLEKMGWDGTSGLGAQNQGEKSFIKVIKKKDTIGLGGEEKNDTLFDPLKVFEEASKKVVLMNESSSSLSSKEEEEEGEEKMDGFGNMSQADRELFSKCGGRRLSRRAGRPQIGKWKREAMLLDKNQNHKEEESKRSKTAA